MKRTSDTYESTYARNTRHEVIIEEVGDDELHSPASFAVPIVEQPGEEPQPQSARSSYSSSYQDSFNARPRSTEYRPDPRSASYTHQNEPFDDFGAGFGFMGAPMNPPMMRHVRRTTRVQPGMGRPGQPMMRPMAVMQPMPMMHPMAMMQPMMQPMGAGFVDPFVMMNTMMQGMGGFGNMMDANTMGGPAASYSYSSTTYSSAGPDGQPIYRSTTKSVNRRPGDVVERQETERDSVTGIDRMTVHRAVGDRSRTLTRQRDAFGREERSENYSGISQDEASEFDEEWRRSAGATGLGFEEVNRAPRQTTPQQVIDNTPYSRPTSTSLPPSVPAQSQGIPRPSSSTSSYIPQSQPNSARSSGSVQTGNWGERYAQSR